MAKQDKLKVPKGIDLQELILKGKQAEKEFIEDSAKEVRKKSDIPIESYSEPIITETEKVVQPQSDLPGSLKDEVKSKKEVSDSSTQTKEDENLSQLNLQDIPYEEFLKKYTPAETDKRESSYIYTTNLYILKSIATSEKSTLNDMVNNILSAWIQKYQKNIKKSLQKPSRSFGF